MQRAQKRYVVRRAQEKEIEKRGLLLQFSMLKYRLNPVVSGGMCLPGVWKREESIDVKEKRDGQDIQKGKEYRVV